MNAPAIEAILFDMGGTLRSSTPQDPAHGRACIERLAGTIGAEIAPEALQALLARRARAYGAWSRQTLIELNERDLWTQWMLPDWPPEQIAPLAVTLNQLWRESIGRRVVFPETQATLIELFRRGYRLGLVSNTTSSIESPALLHDLNLSGMMETVLLSCVVGMRKPDPAILLSAARRMKIAPERCAYVGDRIDRDVAAARQAGFGLAVIRGAPGGLPGDPVGQADDASEQDAPAAALKADYTVADLSGLLGIFPPRPAPQPEATYAASLSTMWARQNLPGLGDFFEAARRMGFEHVELNHQVDSAMLAPLGLNDGAVDGGRSAVSSGRCVISSVHEPCPADVSTDQLKERDWLISSPDEANRRRGVESIQRSIDLATRLGVSTIVVHCGVVSLDLSEEKKLRALAEKHHDDNYRSLPEYGRIRRNMDAVRAALIEPRFAAVKRSLQELLNYARPRHIRLGLENRYHYYDIPSPDEMAELLALAGPDELGVIYDIGHAQALDRLGFYPRAEWLQRFGGRIIEAHLHDVQGVNDHFAPGLGEVDYSLLAEYLPEDAIRTFEVHWNNTPEQVLAGLKHLKERGIVREEPAPFS